MKHSRRDPLTDNLNIVQTISSFMDIHYRELDECQLHKDQELDRELKCIILECQRTLWDFKFRCLLQKRGIQKETIEHSKMPGRIGKVIQGEE